MLDPQTDNIDLNLRTREYLACFVIVSITGTFSMIIDICANTTRKTDSSVHLIYKKNSVHHYERCQCKIDNGDASISDVRLKSASSGNCSLNKLQIGSQEYSCNATSDHYGSVFEIKGRKETDEYFVMFASDPFHVEPEMIYLTINPAGTCSYFCIT